VLDEGWRVAYSDGTRKRGAYRSSYLCRGQEVITQGKHCSPKNTVVGTEQAGLAIALELHWETSIAHGLYGCQTDASKFGCRTASSPGGRDKDQTGSRAQERPAQLRLATANAEKECRHCGHPTEDGLHIISQCQQHQHQCSELLPYPSDSWEDLGRPVWRKGGENQTRRGRGTLGRSSLNPPRVPRAYEY